LKHIYIECNIVKDLLSNQTEIKTLVFKTFENIRFLRSDNSADLIQSTKMRFVIWQLRNILKYHEKTKFITILNIFKKIYYNLNIYL
jgi:hypothetical protein